MFLPVGHRDTRTVDALLRKQWREESVVLLGPDPSSFVPAPSAEQLRNEMLSWLDFWTGIAARPDFLRASHNAAFAVATIGRIIHTLETGNVVSKMDALRILDDKYPDARQLLDEAWSFYDE